MILTHRRIGISTPPHAEPLRPRFTHSSDLRASGSTALTTAIGSHLHAKTTITPNAKCDECQHEPHREKGHVRQRQPPKELPPLHTAACGKQRNVLEQRPKSVHDARRPRRAVGEGLQWTPVHSQTDPPTLSGLHTSAQFSLEDVSEGR